MDGRALPGYYFDAEKKKYFKILPNHAAPAGSKYSKESITMKNKESKKRKRKELDDAIEKRERVQRVIFKSNPLYGSIGLFQELGQNTSAISQRDAIANAYVYGLRTESRFIAGNPLESSDDDSCYIPAFVYDDALGGLLYGEFHGSRPMQERTFLMAAGRPPPLDFPKTGPLDYCIRGGFHSQLTSASLSPARVALFTTSGAAHRSTVQLMFLTDPEESFSETEPNYKPNFQFSLLYGRADHVSVWSSAANVFDTSSATSTFGVGLSDKASIFTNGSSSWSEESLTTETDVFAVDWMHPTTASLGLRNGLIKLWDHRSQGSSSRLLHPSSVSAIRRVDDSMLVVSGLENSMQLYDLRMSRTEKTSPRRGDNSKAALKPECPTQPVLSYQHANEYHNWLGFDVNLDLGLIAAGTDDGMIRFHSIHTGDLVGVRSNRWNSTHEPYRARCLRFLQSEQGVRLLTTSGPRIIEFAW